MMKIRVMITLALMGWALTSLAQNEDVFTNPAIQSIRYNASYNEVAVGYDYRHATTPMRLEQGDGHSKAFAHVDAYLHKAKATLWGEADYSNGSTRNIQFCETSNFELLYPYLMVDTVGGKSQQEHYHFLGGFSYPLGKRWHIAAEGAYTALMEYRTRDPRPKNLTGDLQAKLAASYRLKLEPDAYMLGLAVSARKYKQTNDVKLYNEVSVPTIYHLTGLGNDYYRFRGMNTSTYYKGYGVGMMLDWVRSDQRGWFAHAEYGYLDIDKIISTLNELPMANIKDYREKLMVGYTAGNERNVLSGHVAEEWTRRRGRENIFGAAQDNVYPQISTMAPYVADKASVAAEVSCRHIFPKSSEWGIKGNLHYDSWKESYEHPWRHLREESWGLGLQLSGKWVARNWLFMGQLSGAFDLNTADKLELADGATGSSLLAPVVHYRDYLSQDRQKVETMIEVGYTKCQLFTPFVRINWQYAKYLASEHQNRLIVAMGVKF